MKQQIALATVLLCLACLSTSVDASDCPATILVTGAAGFIGSHVVVSLTQHGFSNVIAVDNFNADYSVALKRDRAGIISNLTNRTIQNIDICATDAMLELFGNHSVTHIVHLVPHAAIEPDCFDLFLRSIRPKHVEHTQPIPTIIFVQPASTLPTANALHNRFHRNPFVMFPVSTVYGPGDRPDTPLNSLIRGILTGESTNTLASIATEGFLAGYIYIDDIVNEIVASISRKESDKCVIYHTSISGNINLGAVSSAFPKCAHLTLKAITPIDHGLMQFYNWYKARETKLTPCQSECGYNSMCFSDGWEKPAEMSRQLTRDCKVVFYTVGSPARTDELHSAPLDNRGCNIAFINETSVLYKRVLASQTGSGPLTYQNWLLVPLVQFSRHYSDTRKPTRVPKLSPGLFFAPSVDIAIYGDSTIHIYKIEEAIKRMSIGPGGEAVAFAAVQHPVHPSIYSQIAGIVWGVSKRIITYYPKKIVEQRDQYLALQRKYDGLNLELCFDGGMLYHDLRSPVAKEFRCRWMREYMEWCDRDEMSGSFLLAMMNYEYGQSITKLASGEEWIPIGQVGNKTEYAHILTKKESKMDSEHRFYQKTSWHYNA